MQIKNVKVYGLEESIIRSGYPMQIGEPGSLESTFDPDRIDLSDYLYGDAEKPKEVKRAEKLAKTPVGSGHNNYLKGIIVQFDLKYPQYFTPQLQRYHWIDIISSQSKMHKLTSVENIGEHCNKYVLNSSISLINHLILLYNYRDWSEDVCVEDVIMTSKQECFQYIISNLPMGYEMWMGISTNYLQLKTIYNQRKNHKLKDDWGYFCDWITALPMSELITGKNE